MSEEIKTNWGQSVAGVIIEENKVLLVRHTYGLGNGKLIIPGGYVNIGETPQEALRREFLEETGLIVEEKDLIGVRFNMHDWYVVFTAKRLGGVIKADGVEISEIVWMDINDALTSEEVPELTKALIQCATSNVRTPLRQIQYEGNIKHAPYSLYGNN